MDKQVKMLSDLLKEVQNVEINVGDKTYKISTKIKFLHKAEKNYSIYINNGQRMTFFRILKENFEFISDAYLRYKKLKEKEEEKEEEYGFTTYDVIALAVSEAMEQIDIYALMVILYSLIDDETLTFEEFQEVNLEDLFQNNFSEIFKTVIDDISPNTAGKSGKK